MRPDGVKVAVLGTVETSPRSRIVIVRCKEGERGWSEMRTERLERDGEWRPSGARISIPNMAVYLVRDAMDRSCQLAAGDKR